MNIAPIFRRASRVRLTTSKAAALNVSIAVLAFAAASCASTPPPNAENGGQTGDARYPRRGPGCELTVYETAVPGVTAWDDLGIAEAACHINDPVAECVRRLKAEACRMGGDMLYNVPRRPLRPRDQVVVYRGQVAHTRRGAPRKLDDPDMPPPASAEETAGPVLPLPAGPVPATEGPVTPGGRGVAP